MHISIFSLGWRSLLRDLRTGGLRLMFAAVALAVAALSSGAFFADRLNAGLQRDAEGVELELVALHVRSQSGGDVLGSGDGGVRRLLGDAEADVVVLAVKPQVLESVLMEISGRLEPGQLVISIVAGAALDTIAWGLDHREIVRVMPNTPARIGEGMSVWTATPEVCETDLERTRCILQALGKEIYVTNEDELDMATALSGTGPAYVFLFMEALVDAGVHLGFSRSVAQELVLQTVRGSVDFASQFSGHLADLRNQVTSPGGTSAEALYQMEKGALRTIVSKAVYAAYQRSRALSRISEPPTVG